MATMRYGYLADGRAIEFTRSVYRGDRYDFVAEMRES
jgi:GntR family transcriptional regulator